MKRVCIVGLSEYGRDMIPWDDPEWEIWGINEEYANVDASGKRWFRRWTRWFQMHHPIDYRSPFNTKDPHHWDWLKAARGFPIYMHDRDPEVPASVPFPREQTTARFLSRIIRGGVVEEYYPSGPAYMLALAALEDFDQVMLAGVRAAEGEWAYQREGLEFWIGVLSQKASLILPKETALIPSVLYGKNFIRRLRPDNFRIWMSKAYQERGAAEKRLRDGTSGPEDYLLAAGYVAALEEVLRIVDAEREARVG